ncbi:hypothetical protein MycrhDRAFT_6309 [Mycolicibacterium rhodesiae JS60]|nr:hypothetical protein MycrhDRAFT_6309 [Mycolicibacterium rhodesiae JS60]
MAIAYHRTGGFSHPLAGGNRRYARMFGIVREESRRVAVDMHRVRRAWNRRVPGWGVRVHGRRQPGHRCSQCFDFGHPLGNGGQRQFATTSCSPRPCGGSRCAIARREFARRGQRWSVGWAWVQHRPFPLAVERTWPGQNGPRCRGRVRRAWGVGEPAYTSRRVSAVMARSGVEVVAAVGAVSAVAVESFSVVERVGAAVGGTVIAAGAEPVVPTQG